MRRTVAERLEIRKTSVIPVSTEKVPLSKADGPQNDTEIAEMRGIPYREAVGALMWVANMTRPDLAYTAHTIAKFGDNPGPEHWKAVLKAPVSETNGEPRGNIWRRDGGQYEAIGMGGCRSRAMP